MNNSDLFATIASWYTIAALAISFMVLSVTIPKIWRQKAVKNGLVTLRRLLLISGGSVWILTGIALVILTSRFYVPTELLRPTIYILLMLFGTMVTIYSISKYFIYTLQYSEESIRSHDYIDRRNRKVVKNK